MVRAGAHQQLNRQRAVRRSPYRPGVSTNGQQTVRGDNVRGHCARGVVIVLTVEDPPVLEPVTIAVLAAGALQHRPALVLEVEFVHAVILCGWVALNRDAFSLSTPWRSDLSEGEWSARGAGIWESVQTSAVPLPRPAPSLGGRSEDPWPCRSLAPAFVSARLSSSAVGPSVDPRSSTFP